MVRYIVRRLLQTVLVLLGATLIVFALMFAGGKGDPIQSIAGDRPVSAAQRAYLMAKYHLDEGFWQRYAHYIKDILSGDLGRSLRGQEIKDILAREWPVTFQLALIALAVTAIFGVSAGIVAGVRRGSIFDASTLVIALILIGIPTVAIAPVAKLFFGVRLGWFPPTASNPASLDELILPGIILGLLSLATTMRLTRASVSENLRSDFVRTATAKGLPRRRVIGVHVLRNTLIPIITFLGVELGSLIGGAIVVETVFNVPGVGAELRRSLNLGDAPMVIAIVTILVIVLVLANLIVDLLYAVLDPRIRRE
jgi:peptide/nickel transport system permease protein/oligopeptide transport system permease protein